MNINRGEHDKGLCLRLSGELIKEDVPTLMARIRELTAEGSRDLFLDMAAVTYIDSQGLGALISTHKALSRQSRNMFLLNLSPVVRKFFTTTGLLGHFRYAESEEGTSPRQEPQETERAV